MTGCILQTIGILLMYIGLILKINEDPNREERKKLEQQLNEASALSRYYYEKIKELQMKEMQMRERK